MEFNFLDFLGNKNFAVDPVFSSLVNVIKKALIVNGSINSKSLKGIKVFFTFINVFQSSIGYVFTLQSCFLLFCC